MQKGSISVARQALTDISNRVELFFKRDWVSSNSGSAGYLDSVTRSDNDSIARLGLKVRPDAYNFDLIRSETMAAAVANFYTMVDAWPSSFYSFAAYLPQFDLEKEDVISLTANFNRMHKVPAVLRAVHRTFGSAKNDSINLVRIVAENLHYILTRMSLEDSVRVLDSLTITGQSEDVFNEVVQVLDELLFYSQRTLTDEVGTADSLQIIRDIVQVFQETVTVSDTLIADMECNLEDEVSVSDYLEISTSYGFGSGPFGSVPFGGKTESSRVFIEKVRVSDDLQFS